MIDNPHCVEKWGARRARRFIMARKRNGRKHSFAAKHAGP
jgi:hypothetical protein